MLYGLGGGAYTLFMLCFSYLGDLASREPSTRLVRTLMSSSGSQDTDVVFRKSGYTCRLPKVISLTCAISCAMQVRFTAVETCLGLGTVGGYYLAGSTTRHLGPLAVLLLSGRGLPTSTCVFCCIHPQEAQCPLLCCTGA